MENSISVVTELYEGEYVWNVPPEYQSHITVTVFDECIYTPKLQAPEWYTDDCVAVVHVETENNFYDIQVAAAGQFRINLEPSLSYPNGATLRSVRDLVKHGITDDTELFAIPSEHWLNNAWFEIYVSEEPAYDQWLDIQHTAKDAMEVAINFAIELLEASFEGCSCDTEMQLSTNGKEAK